MKFSYLTNLVIAGIMVVPAVALQEGSAGSLEESLTRTLVALENLAGLSTRIEAREPGVVRDVIRWTEPPIASDQPSANDELLDVLRAEVGDLQTRVDLERQRVAARADTVEGPGAATFVAPTGEASASTQGLDEDMRRRLAGAGGFAQPPRPETGAAERRAAPAKVALEEEGYAADPLRLARAMYRAGRHQEVLDTLAPRRSEPEARYWMARSLEKLGRSEEALEAYGEVIEMPGAGDLAQRAKEDTDFLRWRMEFERNEGAEEPR